MFVIRLFCGHHEDRYHCVVGLRAHESAILCSHQLVFISSIDQTSIFSNRQFQYDQHPSSAVICITVTTGFSFYSGSSKSSINKNDNNDC